MFLEHYAPSSVLVARIYQWTRETLSLPSWYLTFTAGKGQINKPLQSRVLEAVERKISRGPRAKAARKVERMLCRSRGLPELGQCGAE